MQIATVDFESGLRTGFVVLNFVSYANPIHTRKSEYHDNPR